MVDDAEIFPSRDIGLAGTLLTLKFPLIDITFVVEGSRGQKTGYFNFIDSPKLQEAVQLFWKGGLAVEPRALLGNIRSLKAQVTNVYKDPTGYGSK
jgi:hypothetical protein